MSLCITMQLKEFGSWLSSVAHSPPVRTIRGASVTLAVFLAIWFPVGSTNIHASVFITGLGVGGRPHGVSANGATVVGEASYGEAFRWTKTGGLEFLGFLPAGGTTSASDVSADGAVVVGYGVYTDGQEAFRWTESTGLIPLGSLHAGGPNSRAHAVSADGSVIVGSGWGNEAFRWSSETGMVGMGDLPGGTFFSNALGVSEDGSNIVGTSGSSLGQREAFRWTSGDGMIGLGDLQSVGVASTALDVSADGSVIVGEGRSTSGVEAFRWTEQTGMVGLGDLSGGTFYSRATAVSGDGSIVVGLSFSSLGPEPFLWTSAGGMRSLAAVLNERGLDLVALGWTLGEVGDISSDGRYVVGLGRHNGMVEAFVADLGLASVPEPTSIAICTAALLLSWSVIRGRRNVVNSRG